MTSALDLPPATPTVRHTDESDQPSTYRVVLVDPREERRAITNQLVERSPRLTVVGLAATLQEAEERIRAETADLVLLEIQMPVELGLVAVRALRDQFPDVRIVVSTFHADRATRDAAQACGADAYLAKPLQVDDLVALLDAPRSPS